MSVILRDHNGYEKVVEYRNGEEIIIRQDWKYQEKPKKEVIYIPNISEPCNDSFDHEEDYILDHWWEEL